MTVERYYYEDINDDLDPYPPFKQGWLVAATDYDALAARLAEAERDRDHWRQLYEKLYNLFDTTGMPPPERAADSA